MDERDWLAERFEGHRTRLRAVAYRMLGSLSEADDAVQEAWLRLNRTDSDEIENLGGWLTTVVARVSLNTLRSRNVRREEPFDVRGPEPIVDRADGTDPEHEALLSDSVGLALLVVLETLTPAERLAFVLHDMFAVPFDEIAPMLDRSPQAARQLASRARRRVRAEDPLPRPLRRVRALAGRRAPGAPPGGGARPPAGASGGSAARPGPERPARGRRSLHGGIPGRRLRPPGCASRPRRGPASRLRPARRRAR